MRWPAEQLWYFHHIIKRVFFCNIIGKNIAYLDFILWLYIFTLYSGFILLLYIYTFIFTSYFGFAASTAFPFIRRLPSGLLLLPVPDQKTPPAIAFPAKTGKDGGRRMILLLKPRASVYWTTVREVIWGFTPSYQYRKPSISMVWPIWRFFTAA